MAESSSVDAFARREATIGRHWVENGPSRPLKRDLVLYSDPKMCHEIARVEWDQPGARARKQVTVGGITYRLTFPKLDRLGRPVRA